MKVQNIFLNLIQGIKNALQESKDYTDASVDSITDVVDYTNSVTVNSTYYNTAAASAIRYGNLGFLMYRLTVKSNFTYAQTVPILTLPHTAANDLANMMFFVRGSGASIARPVMVSENNQVFQKYVGNAQSGDTFEFIFLYIVGGVILNLLNNRRVVVA